MVPVNVVMMEIYVVWKAVFLGVNPRKGKEPCFSMKFQEISHQRVPNPLTILNK